MFRSRSWFGGAWIKPKNLSSLEHLKYLYSILEKNTSVSGSGFAGRIRSISEILIWGAFS
uniref:Uncharacterized protein n=1 Tax=Glossina palpalis gambiensis TaxID=67801 RepID=A0A1B0BGZ8_9MUSC